MNNTQFENSSNESNIKNESVTENSNENFDLGPPSKRHFIYPNEYKKEQLCFISDSTTNSDFEKKAISNGAGNYFICNCRYKYEDEHGNVNPSIDIKKSTFVAELGIRHTDYGIQDLNKDPLKSPNYVLGDELDMTKEEDRAIEEMITDVYIQSSDIINRNKGQLTMPRYKNDTENARTPGGIEYFKPIIFRKPIVDEYGNKRMDIAEEGYKPRISFSFFNYKDEKTGKVSQTTFYDMDNNIIPWEDLVNKSFDYVPRIYFKRIYIKYAGTGSSASFQIMLKSAIVVSPITDAKTGNNTTASTIRMIKSGKYPYSNYNPMLNISSNTDSTNMMQEGDNVSSMQNNAHSVTHSATQSVTPTLKLPLNMPKLNAIPNNIVTQGVTQGVAQGVPPIIPNINFNK